MSVINPQRCWVYLSFPDFAALHPGYINPELLAAGGNKTVDPPGDLVAQLRVQAVEIFRFE
jgi:hypothetical protein